METLVESVSTPWSLNPADGGVVYFTSRETGSINKLNLATKTVTELGRIDVHEGRESGLLGMALDPDFASNGLAYVCYSRFKDDRFINQVARVRISDQQATVDKVLIDLPGSTVMHNGCRVVVGADDHLYFSLGDIFNDRLPQDPQALGGKILRLTKDGQIPADNPFGNPVWSLGHRNPQGLAVRPADGSLWSTEHGQDTRDELNLIVRAGNYGWPLCEGKNSCPASVRDYQPAIEEFDAGKTVATSDLIFYSGRGRPDWRGNILFVTLKTGRIYRVVLEGNRVIEREILLDGDFGRLRDIAEDAEGNLIISTDDYLESKILRLKPVAATGAYLRRNFTIPVSYEFADEKVRDARVFQFDGRLLTVSGQVRKSGVRADLTYQFALDEAGRLQPLFAEGETSSCAIEGDRMNCLLTFAADARSRTEERWEVTPTSFKLDTVTRLTNGVEVPVRRQFRSL